jgi:hypothetical protein
VLVVVATGGPVDVVVPLIVATVIPWIVVLAGVHFLMVK